MMIDSGPLQSARVRVASAVGGRVEEGGAGIICVGVPAGGGNPALVLVWDEAERNDGASATNVIEPVLFWLRQRWAGRITLEASLVVQRDSEGCFDHVWAAWPRVGTPSGLATVDWRALRWPLAEPRSEAAFVGLFGARAQRALQAVQAAAVQG